MATTAPGAQPAGFAAVSRAVVSAAADLVAGMERAMAGDSKVRTAKSNAWDAILEDRARAQARRDVDELVASLVAARPGQRSVGSSPRSRASQTARLSSGFSVR